MSQNSVVQRLLEQIEGSHLSFARFVGRVSRHEWDWAPDDGIQSARDVVADLLGEEARLLGKLAGRPSPDSGAPAPELASPSAASAALRSRREATLGVLRRGVPGEVDDAVVQVLQVALALAQLDAHALGAMVMLQRLIDPSRRVPSPR